MNPRALPVLALATLASLASPAWGTDADEDPPFESGPLNLGHSFTFTFTREDVYEYLCLPHPYMTARVTVVDDGRPPQAHEVAIQNYAYRPDDLVVGVGDAVTWTNEDTVMHTVSLVEHAPDVGISTLWLLLIAGGVAVAGGSLVALARTGRGPPRGET